jgi:hypothetical protein
MSIPAGKVIFRSSVFPGLVMTDVMLKVFRGAYKNVKHFEPELRKMEAWLVTHPDRVPKSRWSAFINAWMRNANTYALQEKQGIRTDMPGSERGTHKSEPRNIMDLFKEIANGNGNGAVPQTED